MENEIIYEDDPGIAKKICATIVRGEVINIRSRLLPSDLPPLVERADQSTD